MNITVSLNWKRWLACVVLAVAADAAVLPLARPIYPPLHVRYQYAPLAYAALALGVSSVRADSRRRTSFAGAALGFVVYGVFNGTELTINDAWSLRTAAWDTLYGSILCLALAHATFSV